eukprot:scaffold38240_cov63-Phaeocystis_antarctica.AAC.5
MGTLIAAMEERHELAHVPLLIWLADHAASWPRLAEAEGSLRRDLNLALDIVGAADNLLLTAYVPLTNYDLGGAADGSG